jgi:hypothetical protein
MTLSPPRRAGPARRPSRPGRISQPPHPHASAPPPVTGSGALAGLLLRGLTFYHPGATASEHSAGRPRTERTLPMSELELHEVAHESLLTATSDPPIRRLDLGKDARTRDRVAGSWVTFPGRTAAVNGRYADHGCHGRRGVPRDCTCQLSTQTVMIMAGAWRRASDKSNHLYDP